MKRPTLCRTRTNGRGAVGILTLPGQSALWLFLLFWTVAVAQAYDWGASVDGSSTQSRTDTVTSAALDQQYMVYFNSRLAPAIQYTASARYRRISTSQTGSPDGWRTEWNPILSGVWTLPAARLRTNYSYLDDRDQTGMNNFVSRSFSLNGQTSWNELPRLSFDYSRLQNANDLDLIGIDTRQRSLAGGLDYQFRTASVRYEYQDRRTSNPLSGLTQTSRRHLGQADFSARTPGKLVSLSGSYQHVSKYEKEERAGQDTIHIPLTPLAGLYALDPTPELDALSPFPAFVDGNVDTAAALSANLSGDQFLNIGLDFGTSLACDRLLLYVDTLANPVQRFAVYRSDDNLNWSLIRDYSTALFSMVFRRFELDIPRQTMRYIKIVVEPQPAITPVYATEIRALVRQDPGHTPGWIADHNSAVRLGIRPSKWMDMAVDGTYQRTGRGPIDLGRSQQGIMTSVSIRPLARLRFVGRHQVDRTDYTERPGSRTDNQIFSATAIGQVNTNLRLTATLSRQLEALAQVNSRRLDGANVRLDERFLPGLNGSTEAAATDDHRFINSDIFRTRSLGQSINAEPNSRTQVTADYRIYRLQSRQLGRDSKRITTRLALLYRMTQTISVRLEGSRFREANRDYTAATANASWEIIPQLLISSGLDYTSPTANQESYLHSTQAYYRISERADASCSYSRLYSDIPSQQEFTNIRLGFSFRL